MCFEKLVVFVVVTLMHEGSCFAVTLVTVFQRKDYGWVVIFGTCEFDFRGSMTDIPLFG